MSRLLPVLHASCAEGGKATASLHPAEEHLAAVVDFAAKASRRPRRHHRAAHRAMAWRDGRTSARCCVSVTLRGARPPSRILSRQSRNQKRVAKARPSRRNGRGCLKTSPLLRRNAMHSFLRKFAGAVRGVLCGLDRVFLRGTLRGVAYTKGLQSFLWANRIPFKDFGDYSQQVTAQLHDASLRQAQQLGREIRYLNSSQCRKEDIAHAI